MVSEEEQAQQAFVLGRRARYLGIANLPSSLSVLYLRGGCCDKQLPLTDPSVGPCPLSPSDRWSPWQLALCQQVAGVSPSQWPLPFHVENCIVLQQLCPAGGAIHGGQLSGVGLLSGPCQTAPEPPSFDY